MIGQSSAPPQGCSETRRCSSTNASASRGCFASRSRTTARDVAINGNYLASNDYQYERSGPGSPFVLQNINGTESVDMDGDLIINGDLIIGPRALVYELSDSGTGPFEYLSVASPPASFGTDSAIVDLGGGNAIAAVSAPDAGTVYVFERTAGVWNPTPDVLVSTDSDLTKAVR